MEIEEYIQNRVENQIEWYDKKAIHCQRSYKTLQIFEIILAALIPLLTGYTSEYNLLSIIIGLIGSLIVIIESITKLNKYHENWVQYRTTCELLRYQKNLYLTHSSPYNNDEETIDNLFVRNIENIISSENNMWKNINTDKKDKSTK